MLLAGLLALSAAVGLTACSTTDSMVEDLNVTRCEKNTTRNPEIPYLEVTRDGKDLYCVYHYFSRPCSGEVSQVDCKKNDNEIEIKVDTRIIADADGTINNCMCPVTIYFTIRDIEENKFLLKETYLFNEPIEIDFSGHANAKIFCGGKVVYDE